VPKTEKCPICGVAVKPENLIRHIDSNHPRHADAHQLKEALRKEPGRIPSQRTGGPLRILKARLAVVAAIILVGAGAYYVAPYLAPSRPFPCVAGTLVYHWHPQLDIYSAGAPVAIPANIGIEAGCHQPLHTHDTSGKIHIETDRTRTYSIGDFFTVWGRVFGNPRQMLVNGTSVNPTRDVILYDQETIRLEYASFA